MSTLGDLVVRIGASIDGFSDAMKSVVSQASDAADAVADKLDQVGNVGQRLAILGASLTAAITLPLEEIARKSIDVAGNFEQTRIAFQTLMGSSDAAKSKLSELIQFAQNTPFEIPQVLDGARKLMALGFAANDIVPILRVVGDQAAAMGQGGVGMDRILMNLGKIEAQGKVTGHELRNLGEDDVPALASIALALGKSKEETAKLVSEGKVDAETGINAILRGMQLRTGGLMASQMDSFKAQLSNMKDQITTTFDAIGQTLLPVGKILVNWAQEAIHGVKDLAEWFGQLPAPIQASAIALAAFAAGTGPALVAIGGLGMALPNIMAGFAALTSFGSLIGEAVTGITGYISTVAALVSEEGIAATASLVFGEGIATTAAAFLGLPAIIIGAIAGLAALATWVYTHWDGVKAYLAQVFDGLGEAWNAALGGAINWFTGMMGGAANDMSTLWQGFKGAFMEIWDAIASYLRTVWAGLKADVIDPMTRFLESIPGFKKIETAGSAFTKADHDSSERAEMTDVGHKLRVGKEDAPFALHSKYQADLEKHNAKLKEAVELLAKFKKGYEDGIVSEKDFKQAQANVQFIKDEKIVDESKITAKGKPGKADHNALDAISGQHTHEEAMLAMQRAQVEHDYQMARPGTSGKVGTSAEEQAQADIAAAEKRKDALDAIAAKERAETLADVEAKLKIDKEGQAGHQAILNARQAAEDKYNAAVQKNAFELENVKKQSQDRIAAAQQKQMADDLAAQQKSYEMSLKTVDLQVQADEKRLQQNLKQFEFEASMEDKRLQFQLETGMLSKEQYLRIKQEQYDQAFAMEMAAIQQERDAIEAEFDGLYNKAQTPAQRNQVMADYNKRIQPINEREQGVQNKQAERQQDTKIGIQRDRIATMDNNFFTPFQNSFSSGIANMIKGTQTFKQAWSSMVTSMMSQWVTHVSQMVAQWVTAKLRELVIHATTNEAKVASDTTAAAQSKSISISQHLHEAMLAAKLAAAKTWAAISGIPVIGPVLAPIAAAAAFAGVLAISAESGAVLPNHNTVGFLHAQEMVLPKHISVGLQNLIGNGGLAMPSASSLMGMQQGGGLSSTAMQALRNTAQAASGGDTNHNYHGDLHYHAPAGESMNVDTFGKMFKTYVRQSNMKMA